MKEFTRIAVDYDEGRRGEDVGFWAGEAERFGGLGCGSRVLDLGCGTGLYTVGIAVKTTFSLSCPWEIVLMMVTPPPLSTLPHSWAVPCLSAM